MDLDLDQVERVGSALFFPRPKDKAQQPKAAKPEMRRTSTHSSKVAPSRTRKAILLREAISKRKSPNRRRFVW